MAATVDRIGLLDLSKSELMDFVKGKAAPAVRSTLGGIRLTRQNLGSDPGFF